MMNEYRVLFSPGLPVGAAGIVNTSCEIAVIFDILKYLFASRMAFLTRNLLLVAQFDFI